MKAMPFCTSCGTQVTTADRFCPVCGGAQAGASSSAMPGTTASDGVDPRTAAMLSYVPWVGWIAAIWALASASFRRNQEVRFHAFQGLYLFVAWLIIVVVLSPAMFFTGPFGFAKPAKMLELVALAAGVFMMVKAKQGERFRLPLLGEWADRSVAEQR